MSFYFVNGFERTFGTFPLRGETLRRSVLSALAVGYRSFDTAQMYDNEADLGSAIEEAGTDREDICITTKVMRANNSPDRFLPSVEESLRKLKTDYVDVLLLHWPDQFGENSLALEFLQRAMDKGYARNIGLSNYTIAMMEDAVLRLDAPVATNQVEFHPLLDTTKLLDAANRLGIPLSSYCSLARGEAVKDSVLQGMGRRYRRTAAQICLRWILQKGVSLNTMSTSRRNQANNFNIMDFALAGPDMVAIDACMKRNLRLVDRSVLPTAPEWD